MALSFVMKGTTIVLLAFAAMIIACGNPEAKSGATALADSLRQKKLNTDHLISDTALAVFVKVKGKKDLVKVENKRYPRDINTTYNILKDSTGRIIYVAELPFDPASDWFIAYKSYFDSTGHLFAFQKINNFLNNGCTHGAAMETLIRYYDGGSKVIDSVYTLTDTYKKPLDKKACQFPYNFPYQVFNSLDELKESRGIPAF